jgi:hypothetical protein
MEIVNNGPELLAQAALDYFAVDGRARRDVQKAILQRVMRNPAVKELAKTELTLKNEYT